MMRLRESDRRAMGQAVARERAGIERMAAQQTNLPKFVISMCRDLEGNVWIGAEDDGGTGGVWRYNVRTRWWQQFTTREGLGDNNGYAVACDKQGRIWVGHLNHGVSVYNGSRWQCYESVEGLSR